MLAPVWEVSRTLLKPQKNILLGRRGECIKGVADCKDGSRRHLEDPDSLAKEGLLYRHWTRDGGGWAGFSVRAPSDLIRQTGQVD